VHQTTILNLEFLFFHVCLSFFVIGYKTFILEIFEASFDMESEGNCLEEIARRKFIVLFEVVEKCLFVTEMEVVGEMIMHSLILAVEFPKIETLLPFIQRFVSYIFEAIPIQILFELRHYFIKKLLVF